MSDKSIICGLAFQCPHENRLETCPLYYMEEKKFIEKLALIEKMSQKERAGILKEHANCRNKYTEFENGQVEIICQQTDIT